MVRALQEALTINPNLISYFRLSTNLMMLLYACPDLAHVEEVMWSVNLKLPEIDEVQQTLRQASDPWKPPYVLPYVEWYAVKSKTESIVGMPVKVLISFPNKEGLTYAQITEKDQWTITIPPQASSIIDIETLISVDEILKQLTDIGIGNCSGLLTARAYAETGVECSPLEGLSSLINPGGDHHDRAVHRQLRLQERCILCPET